MQNKLMALYNLNTSEEILDTGIKPLQEYLRYEQRVREGNHNEQIQPSKLIALSVLSAFGTLGNIFAIAAVVTEDQLKKKGSVLIVNLLLASLLITAGKLPADIVALLAGWQAPTPVCEATWILFCLAAYTSLATLPCIAWENRLRLTGHQITSAELIALVYICWTISVSLTCVQWIEGFGSYHCGGSYNLDAHVYKIFKGTVFGLLVIAPLALSIVVHSRTILNARITTDPPRLATASSTGELQTFLYATERELALPATNLTVSVVVGSCWVVGIASDWWADDKMLGFLIWFPLSAATFTGILYGVHKPFRESYIQIFYYCCCKESGQFTYRARNEFEANFQATEAAVSRVHVGRYPILEARLAERRKSQSHISELRQIRMQNRSVRIGVNSSCCSVQRVPPKVRKSRSRNGSQFTVEY